MAAPRADSYTAASGGVVYGGRSGISNRAVVVGDSLTAASYGSMHTFVDLNATSGGVLKLVKNLGVAAETVQNVLSRIDNLHTDTNPGMGGLSDIGFVALRIGTNDARGGSAITTTIQAAYAALITKLLGYAGRVIVMAVPPISSPSSGAGVNSFNAWLESYCAGISRLHFIDDTTTVNSGAGTWATGYAPGDGIHYGAKAAQRMAIDGAAAFNAIVSPFNFASPISLDPADVYPAQPQWVRNPLMTGGTTAPTNWGAGTYGGGNAVTSSIVAADVGDTNQTPWFRLTPTAINKTGGGWITAYASLSGRTITISDPNQLDVVVECRFNGLDGTKFSGFNAVVFGNNNQNLSAQASIRMGGEVVNGIRVMRIAEPRGVLPTSGAHTSASLNFSLGLAADYAGSMGSVDVRCATVRG